jgi:hypothetical protein
MNENILIREFALYEYDQAHSAAEAARNIRKIYGANSLSDSNCRKWFSRFKEGDRGLQDLPREGRPKILDHQALKSVVDENPYLTTRELESMFECCSSTIINGLREIGSQQAWKMAATQAL